MFFEIQVRKVIKTAQTSMSYMDDVDKIQGFDLNFASWLKRTILERNIVVMKWMWKGLSSIWFRGWLRWERFVWLMISLLSVISHYNRCRVSRDVSGIRRLILSTWIIFLHLGLFRYHLLLKTENWKYGSKIIFKCVNSTVRPIFNKNFVEKRGL